MEALLGAPWFRKHITKPVKMLAEALVQPLGADWSLQVIQK